MQRLVERREDPTLALGISTVELELCDLPKNVGSTMKDKPSKTDAVSAHQSRFGYV